MTDDTELPPYRYWRPCPPLPGLTDIDRFWSMVIRADPAECWPWRTRKVGMFWWVDADGARQHQVAPRFASRVATGMDFRPREIVAHRCDWRPCCNPLHLERKSRRGNTIDCVTRGRHGAAVSESYRATRDGWWKHGANKPGEGNGTHKLTDASVREIRRRYAEGARQVDLAAEFSVWQTAISKIVNRKTWSHLD